MISEAELRDAVRALFPIAGKGFSIELGPDDPITFLDDALLATVQLTTRDSDGSIRDLKEQQLAARLRACAALRHPAGPPQRRGQHDGRRLGGDLVAAAVAFGVKLEGLEEGATGQCLERLELGARGTRPATRGGQAHADHRRPRVA